jgi:phage gp36-like protein
MYIEAHELKTGMYWEQINNITRKDSEIISENILCSMAEIDTYLNSIYDTDYLWLQTGSERHPLIKRILINITVYNICEPLEEIPAAIVDNHKKAIEMLENIRDGKNVLNIQRLGTDENEDGEISEDEEDEIIVSGGISQRF